MSKWKWVLINDDNTLAKGWNKIGDYWYLLDSNTGIMLTGWQKVENNWYYLDPSTGQMQVGWFKDKDKWYYLNELHNDAYDKGVMVANCTIDINGTSYTFNSDGVWQDNSSLVSEDCIDFVKGYEKFYSYKYDDGTGTITQGYGCIGDEIADWGDNITEQQASDRLKELINSNYAKPIKEYLEGKGVKLTVPQFDALVSCSYNIGVGSLEGSTLMRYIVNGGRDADTIQSYFCMWSKATINGVSTTLSGLYKRRVAEANIFNNGIYDSSH